MLSANLIEYVKLETRRGGSLHYHRVNILKILECCELQRRQIEELKATIGRIKNRERINPHERKGEASI